MSSEPENYVNGRVVGGYSTHDAYKPELCSGLNGTCGPWRCVDCCGVIDEIDIVECQKCGKQVTERCSFDEDFA